MINLESKEKTNVYENDDLDNWKSTQISTNGNIILINLVKEELGNVGKIINYSIQNKQIQVMNSNQYKITNGLKDNKFSIFSFNLFTIYSGKDNSYLQKIELGNLKIFPTHISDNNNILIVQSLDDKEIYLLKLDL